MLRYTKKRLLPAAMALICAAVASDTAVPQLQNYLLTKSALAAEDVPVLDADGNGILNAADLSALKRLTA